MTDQGTNDGGGQWADTILIILVAVVILFGIWRILDRSEVTSERPDSPTTSYITTTSPTPSYPLRPLH